MTESITQRDQHLHQLILLGKALEAFETYYGDDVVMQENSDTPRQGKDLNRQYEVSFFSSVEVFHGAEVRAAAVAGDVTGQRVRLEQVAVRRWKDGRVAHERFYYNKG